MKATGNLCSVLPGQLESCANQALMLPLFRDNSTNRVRVGWHFRSDQKGTSEAQFLISPTQHATSCTSGQSTGTGLLDETSIRGTPGGCFLSSSQSRHGARLENSATCVVWVWGLHYQLWICSCLAFQCR